jgi:hypothetical protein
MAREDNMKKKIKKFAEGGEALNLSDAARKSLNVESGLRYTPNEAKAATNWTARGAGGMYHGLQSVANNSSTHPIFKLFSKMMLRDPSKWNIKNANGVSLKKGGKVKAKRKPIDGIAKSGKTRAKHRKDR